ncbi:hypothetical protein SDC9_17711 [bioreactor metagenome]|jgi:hypothetical protein|uniref:Uncharacterized protein n=1 Tax=bioreactor metagenome TaxID=1076179 RepID=A0A644U0G3_9ZZZZ|nr:hypothetical protein [Lentimicrobium sp.]MEA5111651.1 hypothetical protein [Lentimicrobium sp.]
METKLIKSVGSGAAIIIGTIADVNQIPINIMGNTSLMTVIIALTIIVLVYIALSWKERYDEINSEYEEVLILHFRKDTILFDKYYEELKIRRGLFRNRNHRFIDKLDKLRNEIDEARKKPIKSQ